MSGKFLIWCGSEPVPKNSNNEYKKIVKLNTYPGRNNVFLNIENISTKLVRNIDPIAKDLLEIGSYVYCADQSISRGGKTWRRDGKYWIRNFRFDIPVRMIDLWDNEEVKSYLMETLGYLSDDNYEFNFRPLTDDIPDNTYFNFDEGAPWFDIEEILLFSGGLDSMGGVIEEIMNQNKRVALISHRPISKISKRQIDLLKEFDRLTNTHKQFLHIPVWVNKESGITKDTDQRARSFLYATLAACVAKMTKVDRIKFYENGIVSTNLPISQQVVGARASRSTHPKVLNGFSNFLSKLFGIDFNVENPFYWRTKAEVVQVFVDTDLTGLIKFTHSCGHTRTTDNVQSHCGMCTQCIERRIATLHNEIGDDDPEDMYRTNLFLDPIEKSNDRTMAESYFRHGLSLGDISDMEFFGKFGEVQRIYNYLGLSCSESAEKIYKLHKRHGEQVHRVVTNQIKLHADKIAIHQLSQKSLLAILVDPTIPKPTLSEMYKTFPTPDGTRWSDIKISLVSNDSIKVVCKGESATYLYGEIGFKDKKRGDLPKKSWEAFKIFAENSGTYRTEFKDRSTTESRVREINKTMKRLFGIESNPILYDRKEKAYKTSFAIEDRSFR